MTKTLYFETKMRVTNQQSLGWNKNVFCDLLQFTVIVKTDESYLFKNFQKIRGKFIKKSIKWVEV